jgi:hypothetical protein
MYHHLSAKVVFRTSRGGYPGSNADIVRVPTVAGQRRTPRAPHAPPASPFVPLASGLWGTSAAVICDCTSEYTMQGANRQTRIGERMHLYLGTSTPNKMSACRSDDLHVQKPISRVQGAFSCPQRQPMDKDWAVGDDGMVFPCLAAQINLDALKLLNQLGV